MKQKLTEEQKNIIASDGSIKVNAVAGSGKTTVILEYARLKPSSRPSLYLVFNRTAREEAQRKAREAGISNLHVLTSHALAYRHIRPNSGSIVFGYTPMQVREILGIAGKYTFKLESILAKHIIRLAEYYCNSSAKKIRDLDYLEILDNAESIAFTEDFHEDIYDGARQFLGMMYRGQISLIHDYYLKMFQLSEPRLDYERIFFDESQDASEVMLDVVKRQSANKMLVGDRHQRIYGWRYAVDSMDADYPEFKLTGSFRFDQRIASEAVKVLDWKRLIDKNAESPPIIGLANNPSNPEAPHAYLARTNAGILKMAVEKLDEGMRKDNYYFEGGLNSYLFGSESASIYDILNLALNKSDKIRNPFIKNFRDIEELKEYTRQTGDRDISFIVDIVETYGRQLPGLISEIKARTVPAEGKNSAGCIFSTVHRCKGLEYEGVKLGEDFIRKEDMSPVKMSKLTEREKKKLLEEINILYVAITRSRNSLVGAPP